MTHVNLLEVPRNILTLLSAHLSKQDDYNFYRGFLVSLGCQYPDSKLFRFYDEHCLDDDFYSKFVLFVSDLLNSGSSAPPLPSPVLGKGTYSNFELLQKIVNDIDLLKSNYDQVESLSTVSVIEELECLHDESKQVLNRVKYLTNS